MIPDDEQFATASDAHEEISTTVEHTPEESYVFASPNISKGETFEPVHAPQDFYTLISTPKLNKAQIEEEIGYKLEDLRSETSPAEEAPAPLEQELINRTAVLRSVRVKEVTEFRSVAGYTVQQPSPERITTLGLSYQRVEGGSLELRCTVAHTDLETGQHVTIHGGVIELKSLRRLRFLCDTMIAYAEAEGVEIPKLGKDDAVDR
jgi:hypothetical protein